jgi:predicted site-specific integrase-resolvase
MEAESTPSPSRFLTARSVCERYQIHDATLKRWCKRGLLPTPVVISGRKFFSATELDEFDARRLAGRDLQKHRLSNLPSVRGIA